MAAYEIDISMSAQTVSELQNGGFALYAFKAVQAPIAGGAPLVWFMTQSLMTTTSVSWQDNFQAYVSTSEIIPNGMVSPSATLPIGIGQTAQVDQNGNLTPSSSGPPSAISILNQGTNPWTAGVSQQVGGQVNPVCALPLYGNMLDAITPLEKVLLMFATATVNTGTVIYQAYSPGLFVDLTGASQRSVTFDINQGWSWDGSPWAQPIGPGSDLIPLLITN